MHYSVLKIIIFATQIEASTLGCTAEWRLGPALKILYLMKELLTALGLRLDAEFR